MHYALHRSISVIWIRPSLSIGSERHLDVFDTIYTLLEKRFFYTSEKEFSKCPCIRTLFEN